ncbi:MAG: hypothetical protein M3303_06670 [Gemmatimonadota bacterium]|nr:hypothetical protein [Gemmatimonadota bacterium]
MRKLTLKPALIAVAALVAACSKTEDGQLQVQVPDVDVKVGRDTVTVPAPNLPDVDIGTKRDTITTPTIGTKRTEVQRPTVDTKRP